MIYSSTFSMMLLSEFPAESNLFSEGKGQDLFHEALRL